MKTNIHVPQRTYEWAKSDNISDYEKLKRLTLACMLWEDQFYIDGKSHVTMIRELCQKVDSESILQLATYAHNHQRLRHVPLLLILEVLKKKDKATCAEAIYSICSRPDQMTELLSLYLKDKGKKCLPRQLKRGLAKAFTRFDEYQLAKYNRDNPVKLKDVLFLCHAKAPDKGTDDLWKRLINNTLKTPDTWETKLSEIGQEEVCDASKEENKKEAFEALMYKGKMGKLAVLRNLRNMHELSVKKELVELVLLQSPKAMLPFQFIAAANACPMWEDIVERSMLQAIKLKPMIMGKTAIFVDVSSSMDGTNISGKSKMTRMDAACAFAILLREICENGQIMTFSMQLVGIPPRQGFGLRDAIIRSQVHSGTYTGAAVNTYLQQRHLSADVERIIIITDEQSHDQFPYVHTHKNYILNVGAYQNGLATHGQWLTISGFAEASIDFIQEVEIEEYGKESN